MFKRTSKKNDTNVVLQSFFKEGVACVAILEKSKDPNKPTPRFKQNLVDLAL